MDAEKEFAGMTVLGDAIPFVPRIHEIIETIALFEDFEPDDLECLARHMQCFRAPAGSEIIAEGALGDFMILLLDGSVEIVKLDVRGLPAQVATAGPGKTLGEMSLIDGEPRFASCIAISDVEFAVLDRESLSRMIAEKPLVGVKLMMEFLMLLNQRLRNVSSQLMDCMESRRNRIR
jgi:CRP/FNR family transcriptional regulator, cyclic AMP receptor protein